jgi:hypothetical protein
MLGGMWKKRLWSIYKAISLRLDQGETRSVKIAVGQECCLSPVLFNLYSEYLTKETLGSFGDFKVEQVIHTVKYADDLVLLAKEEMMLQSMIDRLTEIGRCYGMEMNVEKTKVMSISIQPSPIQIMIYKNNGRMWNTSTICVA